MPLDHSESSIMRQTHIAQHAWVPLAQNEQQEELGQDTWGLLTVHQVQDEAEFVWCVEGVGHADNEGTVLEQTNTSL